MTKSETYAVLPVGTSSYLERFGFNKDVNIIYKSIILLNISPKNYVS